MGFYASRSYAERWSLPERSDDWKHHKVIGFADRASNAELGRWSDHITREASVVMRCSSQADMLAAVRAGIGICAMSCIVGNAHPDLVRVAPHKLAGSSDMWLLAHPDLIDLPAVRSTLNFVTQRARADRRGAQRPVKAECYLLTTNLGRSDFTSTRLFENRRHHGLSKFRASTAVSLLR